MTLQQINVNSGFHKHLLYSPHVGSKDISFGPDTNISSSKWIHPTMAMLFILPHGLSLAPPRDGQNTPDPCSSPLVVEFLRQCGSLIRDTEVLLLHSTLIPVSHITSHHITNIYLYSGSRAPVIQPDALDDEPRFSGEIWQCSGQR